MHTEQLDGYARTYEDLMRDAEQWRLARQARGGATALDGTFRPDRGAKRIVEQVACALPPARRAPLCRVAG